MDNFNKNNHIDETISEMETVSKVDATNKKPEISHVMAEITQKFWNTLSSPAKVQDEKLRRIMLEQGKSNNTLQWKSNLHNTNFDDAIKPLPCSCNYDPDSKMICKKSEEFSENNYKDFMKMFKSINIPDKTVTKKITKSIGVTSSTNNSNKPTTSRQVDYISTNEIMRNRFFNCKPKNSRKKLEETEEDDDFFKTNKTTNSYKNKKNKLNNEVDTSDERINVNKPAFKTATDELKMQASKKGETLPGSLKSGQRKILMRRAVSGKFVSPMLSNNDSDDNSSKSQEWIEQANASADENLKNIEPRMVELIKSEIMDNGASVAWDDIAGLVFAKTAIQEAVVWPMLRPDIFTGLRRPPKGILLFGPPGTGKTLIGKCVASQSKSTFFTISASSLTSKWVGEGEKMVRALFSVARCYQPSVIFIDEIDSLLSQRSDNEHESSRRIKTEFLVQLDGATTVNEERLLVIGATNRPQELDEAARRRFSKRLYIPLPEHEARVQLVKRLMSTENHELVDSDINKIADMSDGYSGADLRHLCSEACLGPIRSIDFNMMASIKTTDVRSVTIDDFKKSFTRVRSSVSPNDLNQYISWDKIYGSGTFT